MKYKYKVLIVDEDENILYDIKKLLEQETYVVETTQSAMEAFEKVKKDKYHIVLVDTDFHEMNGIELLKEIKRYDALTQVIMMSGHSTMEKILNSLEYGANDYILKPFRSMDHVIGVIDYSVQKLERWRKSIIEIVK
ncbi:response regulator [Lutispora thermophila]|uniref:Stage 0 sporulation protein A homolog n=1 Tax=Lutispora thermophila DSM 19022 TaxID=1122184 RepID=A0A1M6EJQ0_9FIRM|nr:response regulator [Lutispora thermophila]SHI85659.1 Response regulator receiver domain-containing protein [Lutispora thermophila DSM 19022]